MNSATGEIYIVTTGDTLSEIAHRTGKSVSDLVRLNDIEDKNRLEIGQALYLSDHKAFAAQSLFLDALRHPIENINYILTFDGKAISGKTGRNGLSAEIVTLNAHSRIVVEIQEAYGNWQSLGVVISGYGKKLITLVSPTVTFKNQLEPHPPTAPIAPIRKKMPTTSTDAKPNLPPAPKGKPTTNNPSVKANKKKGSQSESVIQIGVDLPQELLAYMQAYEDVKITAVEWDNLAIDLNCEVNVLKAIAKVESGGRSAFWTINDTAQDKAHAPKIVFERHYFHNLTKGIYDKTHPDISWSAAYLRQKDHPIGSTHEKLHDKRVDPDDIYDNKQDYLRLINAFRLDDEAALKSASWGMFQIMGANHELCGEQDVKKFVKKMCKNEAGQIELLTRFIRNNPRQWKDKNNKALGKEISLLDAVKTKNWRAIAFNYNGRGYAQGKYDEKIKSAYEDFCKKST